MSFKFRITTAIKASSKSFPPFSIFLTEPSSCKLEKKYNAKISASLNGPRRCNNREKIMFSLTNRSLTGQIQVRSYKNQVHYKFIGSLNILRNQGFTWALIIYQSHIWIANYPNLIFLAKNPMYIDKIFLLKRQCSISFWYKC